MPLVHRDTQRIHSQSNILFLTRKTNTSYHILSYIRVCFLTMGSIHLITLSPYKYKDKLVSLSVSQQNIITYNEWCLNVL
jgi:hypothetical protein